MHYGLLHIVFNMFILYQVGDVPRTGDGPLARCSSLYLVSVLGGAAGALLLDPIAFTGGASGGVFGLAAAATLAAVASGRAGSGQTTWGPLIVINFLLGFLLADVSIGGHLGGIVAGVLATEAMLQGRRAGQRWLGSSAWCSSVSRSRSAWRCGPRQR